MVREPRIPISPQDRPRQRIYEVVGLPERPTDFDSFVNHGDLPEGTVSRNPPRNPIYLCQVEWAWTPAHNRLDAYYLNKGRAYWSLWASYLDDNDYPWKWVWIPVGCVALNGVDARTAAIHLLIDYWRFDGVEQFHWINEDAFVSVAELSAIAKAVWGDQEAD